MNSPFRIRGAIEGFYGTFYTAPERDDLVRFLGQHGFNLYIYAPKNDRQHRTLWWEPYPQKMMRQLTQTVRLAKENGVEFCYAISPGNSLSYASSEDEDRLKDKLLAFYQIGVRAFSLLLDDISQEMRHAADRERFPSRAAAQADLANRIYAWLTALDPACTLSLCPTEYAGTAPFPPGLVELGERLHPRIDLFYTGPEVCSPVITCAHAQDFRAAAGRVPIIWDNYPVNDLGMQPEMHVGPITGRDPHLYQQVRGLVANLMIQPEASRIALLTFADYLADPEHYDSQKSWESALRSLAGEESCPALRLFAENSLVSCLDDGKDTRLARLTWAALDALKMYPTAVSGAAVQELNGYLLELDEACYQLLYHMDNLALRRDLQPWIELLDLWQRMARYGLEILHALQSGKDFRQAWQFFQEYLDAIRKHPKRMAASCLLPLAEYVARQVEISREPA